MPYICIRWRVVYLTVYVFLMFTCQRPYSDVLSSFWLLGLVSLHVHASSAIVFSCDILHRVSRVDLRSIAAVPVQIRRCGFLYFCFERITGSSAHPVFRSLIRNCTRNAIRFSRLLGTLRARGRTPGIGNSVFSGPLTVSLA